MGELVSRSTGSCKRVNSLREKGLPYWGQEVNPSDEKGLPFCPEGSTPCALGVRGGRFRGRLMVRIHGKVMNAARQSCEHFSSMGSDPMEVDPMEVQIEGGRNEIYS